MFLQLKCRFPVFLGGDLVPGVSAQGGVCSWGSAPRGVCSQGVSAPGGLLWGGSAPGGVCSAGSALRGCLLCGGVCSRGVGLVPRGVACSRGVCSGGSTLGGSAPGGVPCDIYHHAFDVTCMLPPHQLRHINSAPAYILLPGHVTCKACWDAHPPPPLDRHTPIKT